MGFANRYFNRFVSFDVELPVPPSTLNLVVVIPVHNEPLLLSLLDKLWQCKPPDGHVAIIVVVNESTTSKDDIRKQNRASIDELKVFKQNHLQDCVSLHFHYQVFEDKLAGVGSARKLGMDTAVKWFNYYDNANGIIASLDADVEIDSNYFNSISDFFNTNPDYGAAVLRFEHPVSGKLFSKDTYNAIVLYELYLRYFRMGIEYAGYPYPIHTIGSCFAFKVEDYVKAGGMNKRQAGEDFYFLHKISAQTKIGNILDTCVYPSPRVSFRVPFGTGPEVKKIIQSNEYKVYSPDLFKILKIWFSYFDKFYKSDISKIEYIIKTIDSVLYSFAKEIKFVEIVEEAKFNSSSYKNFEKRLFTKINAFQIIKFLNFASDYYPKMSIKSAAAELLGFLDIIPNNEALDILQQYKELEYNT